MATRKEIVENNFLFTAQVLRYSTSTSTFSGKLRQGSALLKSPHDAHFISPKMAHYTVNNLSELLSGTPSAPAVFVCNSD